MPPADAAVAIVEARIPEPSILLIRRTERAEDPWSGHWSFPGGKSDPEDRDALETALRELREECGVLLQRDQLVAPLPVRTARRRSPPFLQVAPFHFRVDDRPETVCEPLEAVEARWVALSTLKDPARHTLRAVPGLPADMLYPAIELGPTPLWGFTYRLITSWLGMDPAAPGAGRDAARAVLEFLLAEGLRLRRDWGLAEGNGDEVETAEVYGRIPVERVCARFCSPGTHIAAVNRLQVRSDSIRIAGPAFEEYLIRAHAHAPHRSEAHSA
jgi:8-oxo-dGTP pyrophosphatase MutT (NUDIX family)